jgi:nucleotide-binding universal stress UspA family protein
MEVLVPIDGSDCSDRALRFAAEFGRRYGATLRVVHFSPQRDERTESLLADAEAVLDEAGVAGGAELITDVQFSDLKKSTRIGENILDLVDERGYDHVVMGHHGAGRVEEFLLGSAAERVVEDAPVPVSIIP